MVAKRSNRGKNREIRHLLANENAFVSIGEIYKGMEIYGLTKGQYSIINIIETILNQTGKADVIISTWTAANAEIKKAEAFLKNGNINKLHFIVDRSFPTRQPKYYKQLIDTFGDIVSLTNSHAKFVIIKNNDWNIVIRTSMNLNENKRLENFEISDDKTLVDYLLLICEDIISRDFNFKEFELLGQDKKYSKYKVNNETKDDIFDFNEEDFELGEINL